MKYIVKNNTNTGSAVKKLKVHKSDTWCVPSTLIPITLALLEQFYDPEGSAPHVRNKDVPKKLRSTWNPDDHTSPTHFKKWAYVQKELLICFRNLNKEYFDDFCPYADLGREKAKVYYKRQNKALKLYGRYFLNLWN